MLRVSYKATFVRQFKKLGVDLQTEVLEKIELLKGQANHHKLKVHKLHGQLKGCFSFSVNYHFRIIFEYLSISEVALLSVGDHDVYK